MGASAVKQRIAESLRSNRVSATHFRRVRTSYELSRNPDGDIAWAARLARPNTIAIDVGANLGQVSAALARRVGARGLVIACEPNPSAFVQLRLATRSLPVLCLPFALGDHSGLETLTIPLDEGGKPQVQLGTFAIREAADPKANQAGHVTVRMHTLDSLLPLAYDAVSMMKIDVEGYEFEVLQGGKKLIEAFSPAMLIEIEERHQGSGRTIDDVFRLLNSWDYRVLGVCGRDLIPQSDFDVDTHQREPLRRVGAGGPTYVNNFVALPAEIAVSMSQSKE
jgi:FkbM family methyltransferase